MLELPVSYIHGFYGGLLIGTAAVLLYGFSGRIMGVSGIVSGLLGKPAKDFLWRAAFVAGLVLGGWIFTSKFPVDVYIEATGWQLAFAGLLVGFGTVMSNGCTSGHGICGIARFSKRSIVATIVFMGMGILTVWLKKILGV